MDDTLLGKTVGSYKLDALLGEGGMAKVYKATQTSLSREVAIKIIDPKLAQEDNFLARFRREVEILTKLEHPHILPVFDFGVQDDILFLVMRLVAGGDLGDRLAEEKFSLEKIVRLVEQLGSALDFAHAQGVIHRDLKPNNVLLDENGNPYLMDFGISKLAEAKMKLTSTQEVLGTPVYMAPEQWVSQDIDKLVDVYALGVMTYEMLTQQKPFTGGFAQLFTQHSGKERPDPREIVPEIPEAVALAVQQAMAKASDERFQSCTEFAQALASGSGSVAAFSAMESESEPFPSPVVNRPRPEDDVIPPPELQPTYSTKAMQPAASSKGKWFGAILLSGLLFAYIQWSSADQNSGKQIAYDSDVVPYPLIITQEQANRVDSGHWGATIWNSRLFYEKDSTFALEGGRCDVSDDGKHIVYDLNNQVATLDVETGTQKILTNEEMAFWGSFSPDGKRMAFHARRNGIFNIYLMNSDGTGMKALAPSESWQQWAAWSPNGKLIAYSSNRGGGIHNIWVHDLRTGLDRQLTKTNTPDRYPAWSPDNKSVAYESGLKGGNFEIFRVELDGGRPIRLTDNPALDRYPVWEPAEKIHFARSQGRGKTGVYSVEKFGAELVLEWNDGIRFLAWAKGVEWPLSKDF